MRTRGGGAEGAAKSRPAPVSKWVRWAVLAFGGQYVGPNLSSVSITWATNLFTRRSKGEQQRPQRSSRMIRFAHLAGAARVDVGAGGEHGLGLDGKLVGGVGAERDVPLPVHEGGADGGARALRALVTHLAVRRLHVAAKRHVALCRDRTAAQHLPPRRKHPVPVPRRAPATIGCHAYTRETKETEAKPKRAPPERGRGGREVGAG
eukprot:1592817-Pyramimonas_sp.AAC.1